MNDISLKFLETFQVQWNVPFTVIIVGSFYLQENDSFDAEDLLNITEDADELRHYFPRIKERLKFKKLMVREDDKDTSAEVFSRHYWRMLSRSFCFPEASGHAEPQRFPY